jgi:GTP-binding protein HflX|tara:strand:- start:20682 stop:21893 length:1212 start_codon:yes stop_codon:yes gene_type:complete
MIEQKKATSEKAILIGVVTQHQDEEKAKEFLDELEFLVTTAGGVSIKRFVQKLEKPHPKTFIGTGKLEEVKRYIDTHHVGTAIFDDELSPAQLRNIEKVLDCKILDRTNLILDIFAQRAQTSYARTQVALAQCQYLLPRLTKLWTHLDKQKGGIGMRGPGETEIETDRRIVREQISVLKKRLAVIDKQMAIQRKNRGKMVRVALVGYTNVGKSTLMNVVSKSDVFAENKLFATLDTTVRKVVVKNLPFLMTDTVGFIRKLPTQLVESFKSTLDEVREADLLLHVVDISHKNFEEHIDSVNKILLEIKSADKPVMMVFNMIDAYTHETIDADDLVTEKTEAHFTLEELQKSWMSKMENNCVFISALYKENLEDFKSRVYDEVKKIHIKRFPYNNFLYHEYTEES